MRAATTPSRRERASPSPVRPKIEHVFTPANYHRHRTPHLGCHSAHIVIVIGQHLATVYAHEHRATTTRDVALASKTLTPPYQRPAATQQTRDERKGPAFRTPRRPQCRDPIGPPKLAFIDPSSSTGRETSSVLPPGARRPSVPNALQEREGMEENQTAHTRASNGCARG